MPDGLAAAVEHGIGETRALVVDGGTIVEAHVERDADAGWRAGDVRRVRLAAILVPGVRAIVAADEVEAVLSPVPAGLTEGAMLAVEVRREALPEAGRPRLAKVTATDAMERRAPPLADRLRARGLAVAAADLDPLGWAETVDAALNGHVPFPGGLLTISPTPAMTVIDVDGDAAPADLARGAAVAAAAAIRRFDIGGSIGIDFPTVADRAVRGELAGLLDAHLPPPFERTAVNGFGFVQIVRPRLRPSFIEAVRDAVPTAALALVRQAERGVGGATLVAAPRVIAWLAARPALIAALTRRRGGGIALRGDPAVAMSAAYVAPP
ncbi:MAG: ribonuclease E/G [Sphingomonadaceae bacterium]|nr:ribonuclease E/G [Sphingomonadaceae bacterium]